MMTLTTAQAQAAAEKNMKKIENDKWLIFFFKTFVPCHQV